ncbi:MAG: hypothetical protein KDC49_00110 [Saprospiraceae bacterium]|nr:hypothetical protein [Saprospiraceae bacterium]
MVEIALCWSYIFLTSFLLGFQVKKWTASAINTPEILSMLGLTLLMSISGFLSLWMKLNHLSIHLVIITFVAIIYVNNRKELVPNFKLLQTKSSILFLLLFVFYVIYKSSGPITNPDTGSYHLPLIRWIEDYPVIKGLANVHSRFGFNYQYFNLGAIYGLSFIKGSTLHGLNGYFYLLIGLYLLRKLMESRQKNVAEIFMYATTLFFFVNMSHAASSFSPDVPASTLACAAIITFLTSDKYEEQSLMIVFLLSVGAFLFKISYFPVLLLNLYALYFYFQRKELWSIMWMGGIFIIMIAPFLIRNYLMSGYLVYPYYKIDLFDVVWKVPMEVAVFEKNALLDSMLGTKNIAGLGFRDMVERWYMTINKVNSAYKLIFLAFCISFIIYTIKILKDITSGIRVKNLVLHVFFLFSIFFWLTNAPDPRFASGFLYLFIGYNLFQLASWARIAVHPRYTDISLLGMSIICLLIISGNPLSMVKNNYSARGWYLLHQAEYPSGNIIPGVSEGKDIRISSDFCWGAKPPCIYGQPDFEWLGPNISDGMKPRAKTH